MQQKTELVLRLLRGELLDAVSRESQVPAHELESWKRIFLEHGSRGRASPRWTARALIPQPSSQLMRKSPIGRPARRPPAAS